MGRPRKLGPRKPCGRLQQKKKDDPRVETAMSRVRDFGVTISQSTNPLAGYLAGVLFLRRRIEASHLGRFYSYLQIAPKHIRGIEVKEHIQHNNHAQHLGLTKRYMDLCRALGSSINCLHELANDRLVVPVNTLKRALNLVPLTKAGREFSNLCETYRPPPRQKRPR
jgi:hypothetical protein